MDYTVGQVFKTLKKSGLYNNTFIFFTADNGYIVQILCYGFTQHNLKAQTAKSYIECPTSNSPDLESGVLGGVAGPLRCGKASTWEGGLRVPGIAWWPRKIAHRRSAQVSYSLVASL